MKWKNQLAKALSIFSQVPKSIPFDTKWNQSIKHMQEDLAEQTIVMIAGEFKAGKSTFINALLGEEVLTSDVTPATAVVTKLTYGPQKRIVGHFQNGQIKEFDQGFLEQLTAERSGAGELIRKTLHYVELQLPNKLLESITILDTPGLNSTQAHHTRATEMFLERADYTIWLFNYQNVGTSTELEVLQKLRDSNMKTVGVVNAIDLHDEEEGEIEEFLQDNLRRMPGLLDGLIGVSARNALEAQQTGDQELLNWSNWQAIAALFDEIQSDSTLKADRILTKLAETLHSLDQALLERRHAFSLSRLEPLITTFLNESFPALLKKRDESEKSGAQWETELQMWKDQFQNELSSIGQIKELIQSLEKARNASEMDAAVSVPFPGDHWQHVLLPEFSKYQAACEPYIEMIEHTNEQHSLLQDAWLVLSNRSLFGKKDLEQLEMDRQQYNQLIEKVRSQKNDLAQKRSTMETQLTQFGEQIKEYIHALCKNREHGFNHEREKWNEAWEELRQSTEELEPSRLQEMDAFFSWLSAYIEAMGPFFDDPDEMIIPLQSFQQCKYLYENSKALQTSLPFAQVMEAYQSFLALPPLPLVQWDVDIKGKIAGASIAGSMILPLPEPLDFDAKGVLHRVSRNRKRVSRLVILAFLTWTLAMAVKSFQESEIARSGNFASVPNSSNMENPAAADATNGGEQPPGTALLDAEQAKAFVAQMHEQLTLHQQGIHQFNTGEWFTYDGWQQFFPYYQSLNGWAKQGVQIVDATATPAGTFLVQTEEMYMAGDAAKIFAGHYEVTADGTPPAISRFSYGLKQANQPVDQTAMSDFLASYRDGYMSALNSGDFSHVQGFLAPNSPAYKELQDYTRSISGKGYRFDSEQFFVNGFVQDEKGSYKALTTEIFTFTDQLGNKTRYTREKEYALIVLGANDFRIQSIAILDTKKEAAANDATAPNTVAPSDVIADNRPPDIAVQERTVDLVSGDEIQNFMTVYYPAFVNAFNGGGFEAVKGYYVPGSKAYEDFNSYLSFALAKKMKMENLRLTVEQVTPQDDSHYVADLYLEDSYHYQDGTGDRKKIRARYLIKVTGNGDMQIESQLFSNILEKTPQ